MSGYEVAILAGGKGTRLRERAGNVPKPLVPVAGRPLLVHQLELCKAHGLTRVLLLVHHLHEQIETLLGDGSSLEMQIGYQVEAQARGTAGALREALPQMASRFLVMYGDTFVDVDLRRFWHSHERAGAAATLFLHPNDHPEDSDLVELGVGQRVTAIHPYPHDANAVHRNLVNAALYMFERSGLEAFASADAPSDIAKHMFPAMLAAGQTLHGYVSAEYIKDMGTPERLDKVEADLRSGLSDRLSLRARRRAVFLDRDGTINREVGHLRREEDMVLLPGAAAAIRALNRQGVLAVVATNQPVVARGDATPQMLDRIHATLEWQLGREGAYLDALYACPHHPERGHAREVPALKIVCACRKPGTEMVDRACIELSIDRRHSWFVGDTTSDIECGQRSGLRTMLLSSGHGGRDAKFAARADYEAPDLQAAVDWIVHGHGAVARQIAAIVATAVSSRVVLIGGQARSGKSSAAQVLKEALGALGRRAHVIPLDSWLKPADERREGDGVLSRYAAGAAAQTLQSLAASREHVRVALPVYDRVRRTTGQAQLEYGIDADDTLIVEGVPALLIPELLATAGLCLFVHADPAQRAARVEADYRERGVSATEVASTLQARAADEVSVVEASSQLAELVIQSSMPT